MTFAPEMVGFYIEHCKTEQKFQIADHPPNSCVKKNFINLGIRDSRHRYQKMQKFIFNSFMLLPVIVRGRNLSFKFHFRYRIYKFIKSDKIDKIDKKNVVFISFTYNSICPIYGGPIHYVQLDVVCVNIIFYSLLFINGVTQFSICFSLLSLYKSS